MIRIEEPNSLLQAFHQVEDLGLDRDVERSRRLVCDQERRAARERHRDHHALAHPARELVGVVVRRDAPGSRCRPRQKLDGPLVRLPPGHLLVRAELLRDLPADAVDGRQRGHRVLEDHRDLAAANRPHRARRRASSDPVRGGAPLPRSGRSGPGSGASPPAPTRSCPSRTRPRCRAPRRRRPSARARRRPAGRLPRSGTRPAGREPPAAGRTGFQARRTRGSSPA